MSDNENKLWMIFTRTGSESSQKKKEKKKKKLNLGFVFGTRHFGERLGFFFLL